MPEEGWPWAQKKQEWDAGLAKIGAGIKLWDLWLPLRVRQRRIWYLKDFRRRRAPVARSL